MHRLRTILFLLCLGAPISSAVAQRPVKVFISVDMEGIGGVGTSEQLGPAGFEYSRFREFAISYRSDLTP